ncbi:hypothetical protein AB205_0147890 [Aquarana catesbeiana]|uniref:RWD domain-containing protein 1 n=1 Tax=Aquarana catesbeiana TaxID=8400 RepID=A0A2G9RTJ4_AQUCT|nr:hypothetical protein AB205_0147890 [Aquarana catesbeiana]
MTDYSEEQRNELEALESIYADSFTVLATSPASFSITVSSEAEEEEEIKSNDAGGRAEIGIHVCGCKCWTRERARKAQENLGMVMIFTLVSAVQDRLNEIVDQIKTRREEEKLIVEKEAEEAEKVRFHGTPVTIENFLSWKAKFDADLAEMRRKKLKEEEQSGKIKLTGKQLFETDHNLDTSDIKFLEEAGSSVEVDESLFQDLDDLELDDEDDPDYNPLDVESD